LDAPGEESPAETKTTLMPKKPAKLNPQQELFCRFYTQNEALFGNATLSYAEAYKFGLDDLLDEAPTNEDGQVVGKSPYRLAYDTCSSLGWRLLRNEKIQARVTELLNEILKDDVVDAQLARLIMSGDGPTRVAAIREYNKLRQRIVDKVDHTTGGKPLILPAEIITKNGLNPGAKGDRA
jgi:hypothetical protein